MATKTFGAHKILKLTKTKKDYKIEIYEKSKVTSKR